jgi:hypothetical protein
MEKNQNLKTRPININAFLLIESDLCASLRIVNAFSCYIATQSFICLNLKQRQVKIKLTIMILQNNMYCICTAINVAISLIHNETSRNICRANKNTSRNRQF